MDSSDTKLNVKQIKRDLVIGIHECRQRGLHNSAKWLAEMNFAISQVTLRPEEYPNLHEENSESFLLAKSYFDLKEYDRAAFYTESCTDPKSKFLHIYSKFLSIEKKKLDNMTDTNCPPDPTQNDALRELCTILKKIIVYICWMDIVSMDIFVEAINAEPLHWGAWNELAYLVPDEATLSRLPISHHWMNVFFLAYVYLEHLQNEEALEIYYDLQSQGFNKSTYIMAQMAIAYHNRRELDKAITMFKDLMTIDPYRLDNLDTYSNLLYVKEMKTELANLAHTAVTIDKYKVETCCVIGNYYSLRSEHAKAILYFQRALKLNPQYLSAWTLIGHEYMEMKNTNAAIQSYRQAIEVNKRDYRAWYGLGQTYEILKMPFYSLYYYKQAQQLRPNDSRMLVALGDTYEKLEKYENALKCYYRACNVGDFERTALVKLAKLYDKLNDEHNSAAAFTDYCSKEEDQKLAGYENENELYNAYQYLSNYHLKHENLNDAYTFAYKCMEYDETKEPAKALLKAIATRKSELESEISQSEQNNSIETEGNTSNMDSIFSPGD